MVSYAVYALDFRGCFDPVVASEAIKRVLTTEACVVIEVTDFKSEVRSDLLRLFGGCSGL